MYLLRVHLQTFLSVPLTQKCQILSYDTLVANERNISEHKSKGNSLLHALVAIAPPFFNIVVMVRLRMKINGDAPVNS